MLEKRERGQGAVLLILALAVITIIAMAAICASNGYAMLPDADGNVVIGNPEQFARATALARAADLARDATREAINYEATVNAANSQATATAAAVSIKATSTAITQIAQATATAVPYQAILASSDAQTEAATEWTGVAALVVGLALCSLAGLAVVTWLNTQARIVRPTASGQMPMIWDGHTLVDPNRMVGPAATLPAQSDWLIQVARAVHLLQTGQALPQEARPPLLMDAGADADHLLQAAQSANAVSATAAMFQPNNAEAGRRAKIELLKKGAPNVMGMLGNPVPTVPTTRIIVSGDSAIEAIARRLGDPLPQLTGPATFNADQDDDTMKE